MYDVSTKIPLIIKPASGQGVRGIREELVNSIDVYGTLLDIAGDKNWSSLPEMESRSLLPLIESENTTSEWENKVYSIIGEDPEKNLCMLRSGSLKIIRRAVKDSDAVYELYDFDIDPFETQNIFGIAEYAEIQEKLKIELDAWWKKQADRYPKVIDKSFQK